ncbi:MAG: AAA family ATPase [Verrucomicrobiia bacterium]
MIHNLKIKRFKSIKEIELVCKRVNLFIGHPNSGKSNILEALGLLSFCGHIATNIKDFIRFDLTQYLFYDGLVDEPIEIQVDNALITKIIFKGGSFNITVNRHGGVQNEIMCNISNNGHIQRGFVIKEFEPIKFYRFKQLAEYKDTTPSPLNVPSGSNLFNVVYGSKNIREFATQLFKQFGFRLIYKLHEFKFELLKEKADEFVSLPYSQVSDTLQRILFYYAAIESNENATLIFEEPESNAFPYYVKFLSELIALNEKNQYFITTHNPYFLQAILEKTKKEHLAIFAVYYKDGQTKIKPLFDKDLERMFEGDPFFMIDDIVGEK